jgi:hypothetical protein
MDLKLVHYTKSTLLLLVDQVTNKMFSEFISIINKLVKMSPSEMKDLSLGTIKTENISLFQKLLMVILSSLKTQLQVVKLSVPNKKLLMLIPIQSTSTVMSLLIMEFGICMVDMEDCLLVTIPE